MPALSFSELNSTKVLPDVKVTSTEGNPAIYASRQAGGRKQKKQQKQKKSMHLNSYHIRYSKYYNSLINKMYLHP
jgi:hypothetical protein